MTSYRIPLSNHRLTMHLLRTYWSNGQGGSAGLKIIHAESQAIHACQFILLVVSPP
jgi:hypothetical protein